MSEATPEPTVSALPSALVASGMLTPADFHGWLAVDALPDEADRARQRSGQRFQDDGDVVLLLGTVPASLLEPDFTPDPAALPLTMLGLIHEGVIKSAFSCGNAPLADALIAGCGVGCGDAGQPLRGVALDFTPWCGDDLAPVLTQPSADRVLITVGATDVGRVVRQARILGVPAVPVGRVGGDVVTVKTAAKEATAPLAELTGDQFAGLLLAAE